MRAIVVFRFENARLAGDCAKFLRSHGHELISGVFDVQGTPRQMHRLASRLENMIHHDNGQAIFIPLCAGCRKKAFSLGIQLNDTRDYSLV